jgi:hypothetical protein
VNHDFRPWGDPINWRDPAKGINQVHDGFGGPTGSHAVQFLLADGSVRRIGDDIDPTVLRALATPAAGDQEAVRQWFDEEGESRR